MFVDGEFHTSDTPLAAYLVQEGFELLIINYTPRKNGRNLATFVFRNDSTRLEECVSLYNRGEATANVVLFEHARQKLMEHLVKIHLLGNELKDDESILKIGEKG